MQSVFIQVKEIYHKLRKNRINIDLNFNEMMIQSLNNSGSRENADRKLAE